MRRRISRTRLKSAIMRQEVGMNLRFCVGIRFEEVKIGRRIVA